MTKSVADEILDILNPTAADVKVTTLETPEPEPVAEAVTAAEPVAVAT